MKTSSLHSEFKADAHALAMRNALTNTDIKQIAENREILANHNEQFSHKIKTKGISNQKASGRCWMFAGLNTIKPVVMNKLDLGEFEFSQIYLQFWDKLEKADAFHESMIEFRDRDLMDRDIVFLLKDPARDDGYWENFVDLVNKYGVIPKEAMAETASSENTGMLNRTLAACSAGTRSRCGKSTRKRGRSRRCGRSSSPCWRKCTACWSSIWANRRLSSRGGIR